MSNVYIYVVDLKRVQPFGGLSGVRTLSDDPRAAIQAQQSASIPANGFKAGQHVRRSFVKEKPGANGMRPRYVDRLDPHCFQILRNSFYIYSAQVKIEEASSDKSGTDPEDSSDNNSSSALTAAANTDVTGAITDYHNYENIFRPRRRELNRTPPMPDDEPFQVILC